MATINDVAKMAGVSAATVSHVVNKTRYVSPELVKRVEDAIEALEFPPNFVIKKNKAAALTTSHKFVVLLASNIHTVTAASDEHVIQVLVGHEEDSNVIDGLKSLYELNGYTFE